MAAIPDTGGAQCAHHLGARHLGAPRGMVRAGMVRALSRVVVLGGMVVAGWLLGSGIGFANEDPGPQSTDLVQLASHPGDGFGQPQGWSDGRIGVPPALGSAVSRVCSAVCGPQRSVPSPVRLGVLRPIADAVGTPKPLAQVLNPRVLVPRVLVPRVVMPLFRLPLSRLALSPLGKPGAGIRSQAPPKQLTTAPLAKPAGRSAAATAPITTLGSPTVPTTVDHALPASLGAAAAECFTVRSAFGRSAFGDDPAGPVPVSPPASTTSSCVISSTGSGAGTKSAADITMNDGWATAEAALMYRLRRLAASDLPRSAAIRPSTSPD